MKRRPILPIRHPDGGSAGTEGCLGIVGNADVQRRFREDMLAELRRNGGSYLHPDRALIRRPLP